MTQRISEKVKGKLLERDMSVITLAGKVGCHPNSIYRWIRGEQSIGSDLLEAVLEVLGLKVK